MPFFEIELLEVKKKCFLDFVWQNKVESRNVERTERSIVQETPTSLEVQDKGFKNDKGD